MKRLVLIVLLGGMTSLDAMQYAKKAGQKITGVANSVASTIGGAMRPVINGLRRGKDVAVNGTQAMGAFVGEKMGCGGPRKKFGKKTKDD